MATQAVRVKRVEKKQSVILSGVPGGRRRAGTESKPALSLSNGDL